MNWDAIIGDTYRISPGKFTLLRFLKAYRNQGFRFIFFHRLINIYAKNKIIRFISRVMLRHYCYKFGFQINHNAKIGKGIYFGHFGTVVINEDATIGENCNINHNVTIGRQNRGSKKGSPIIGDRVWIGTGSVIVGKITIGNDVLVAPLSYINFDIPSHSIAIGNPAKVISKENPTLDYINNINPK